MIEQSLDGLVAILTRIADQADAGAFSGVGIGDGAAAGKAATGGKGATTTGGKGATVKVTVEQVKAAVIKVKDEIGEDEAKTVIEKFAGKKKKLADLVQMPAKFAEVVAFCAKVIEDGELPADEDDESGGL